MFLRPTSPTEIDNVIFQLNSNKSCVFDGINAKFVITALFCFAKFVITALLSFVIYIIYIN